MFASQVLSVLQYLGNLRPPVIHRDIKVTHGLFHDSPTRFLCLSSMVLCFNPCRAMLHIYAIFSGLCAQPENIILGEETGNVKLVDFGAVQDVASSTLIGSTVVGTVRFSCFE